MRHRIDGTGARALLGVGIASWYREGVADDRRDHPTIGRRRQAVADAEVHIEDAGLEIGYGK